MQQSSIDHAVGGPGLFAGRGRIRTGSVGSRCEKAHCGVGLLYASSLASVLRDGTIRERASANAGRDRGGRLVGTWLDLWIPRLLQILGLLGVALSIVQAGFGEFQPVLFGGCLTAASGGFLGNALRASKGISETLKDGDIAT